MAEPELDVDGIVETGLKRSEPDTATGTVPTTKRLKRSLTQESDVAAYEKNIHDTMKSLPGLRLRGNDDYARVFTLFGLEEHARDRRNKVFEYFNSTITKSNCFQTKQVYDVSQELLSIMDEFRELLELLINWCDLCLPANEQAFAEAHRIKIQDFQEYLMNGLNNVAAYTNDVNSQVEKRAQTLRLLFTSKDVLPQNHSAWERTHRDLLVHLETNAYLQCAKMWEKLLEDLLLFHNYYSLNIENNNVAFLNGGRRGGDYFG